MSSLKDMPLPLLREFVSWVLSASSFASQEMLERSESIRVKFAEMWQGASPLYDWYYNNSSQLVHKVQLRKERHHFLHEYLAFTLQDGRCYRLDRHLLSDEKHRFDSVADTVEACDTITEVEPFDQLDPPSECQIEIEFNVGLHLGIILRASHAIHRHPFGPRYDLFHFNCYFFARTILYCVVQSTSYLYHDGLGPRGSPIVVEPLNLDFEPIF